MSNGVAVLSQQVCIMCVPHHPLCRLCLGLQWYVSSVATIVVTLGACLELHCCCTVVFGSGGRACWAECLTCRQYQEQYIMSIRTISVQTCQHQLQSWYTVRCSSVYARWEGATKTYVLARLWCVVCVGSFVWWVKWHVLGIILMCHWWNSVFTLCNIHKLWE